MIWLVDATQRVTSRDAGDAVSGRSAPTIQQTRGDASSRKAGRAEPHCAKDLLPHFSTIKQDHSICLLVLVAGRPIEKIIRDMDYYAGNRYLLVGIYS